MNAYLQRALRAISYAKNKAVLGWKWYRSQKSWKQIVGALGLFAIVIALIVLVNILTAPKNTEGAVRTVTLESAGSLSGGSDGTSVIGTVRSMAEAKILAESSGTVRRVHTQIGSSVPAGFVIAELENAAQRATVLQAEGAYDAAVAARSGVSPVDSATAARNAYQAAYSALDYALETQIDSYYGNPGPFGPTFLIGEGHFPQNYFPQKRDAINQMMIAWREHLATAATSDPEALLSESIRVADAIQELLVGIAEVSNKSGSSASATQLANLATARSSVSLQASTLSSARESYRNKSVGSSASVDASVKQALGSLRGAQAQLEKTLVRAPIGGTINFLPIRVGEYVTAYTHAATVAQNGSLEVLTYVSEEERAELSVGQKVVVMPSYTGVITSISPALDPSTHQIEVHVAVTDQGTSLVNGQSVRITLPGTLAQVKSDGPLMLPLASVKLRTNDRVVFTVNEEGRLVEHSVRIGEVHGGRIEVLSGIAPEARIVTDARGLSGGQKVSIADAASI